MVVPIRKIFRSAARCSRVIGTVQAAAARACLPPSRFGQVLIDRQEERRSSRCRTQSRAYHRVLLGLGTFKAYIRSTRGPIDLIDCSSSGSSRQLLESRSSHQYLGYAHLESEDRRDANDIKSAVSVSATFAKDEDSKNLIP